MSALDADRVSQAEMGDPCIGFLVVRPPYSGDADTVRAYLYAHAYLLEEVSSLAGAHLSYGGAVKGRRYGPVVIVAVVVAPTRDVDYLVQYQADRLRSGGMRVQECGTWTQAWNAALALAEEE